MPVQGNPISGAPVTVADIKVAVQADLGGSGVELEIQDSDYTNALKAALRELNGARPQRSWGTLPYASGNPRYQIQHPTLIGITDVQFVRNVTGNGCDPDCLPMAVVTAFGAFPAPGYADALETLIPGDMPADVAMVKAFSQTVRDQLSDRQLAWEARREQGGLFLYISAPVDSGVSFEFSWGATADDDPDTGVGVLRERDLQWVIDFTRARAKQILGRVRGKFGGINLPGGGNESVDAEALLQEGRDEEQQLRETLKGRRRPILPEIG